MHWGRPHARHGRTGQWPLLRGWWVDYTAHGGDGDMLSPAERLAMTAPYGEEEALRVAAEHFALCPDNVWQAARPATLAAYARNLVDMNRWSFWWD